jgi:hypothetical protein
MLTFGDVFGFRRYGSGSFACAASYGCENGEKAGIPTVTDKNKRMHLVVSILTDERYQKLGVLLRRSTSYYHTFNAFPGFLCNIISSVMDPH